MEDVNIYSLICLTVYVVHFTAWKSPARLRTQLVPYTGFGGGVGVGVRVGIGVAAAAAAGLGSTTGVLLAGDAPAKKEGTAAPGGTPSAAPSAAAATFEPVSDSEQYLLAMPKRSRAFKLECEEACRQCCDSAPTLSVRCCCQQQCRRHEERPRTTAGQCEPHDAAVTVTVPAERRRTLD